MANIYKNAKLDLTVATAVTLYTCPENSRAILKSLYISDDSGSGSTITIKLFNGNPATADSFSLYNTKTVAADDTEQLILEPLIMQENEVIQVTAADANRLHVILSILEINRE